MLRCAGQEEEAGRQADKLQCDQTIDKPAAYSRQSDRLIDRSIYHLDLSIDKSRMSLPYHRGHTSTSSSSSSSSSSNNNMSRNRQWGTKEQRVEETNRTLMEQENDARLVGKQYYPTSKTTKTPTNQPSKQTNSRLTYQPL